MNPLSIPTASANALDPSPGKAGEAVAIPPAESPTALRFARDTEAATAMKLILGTAAKPAEDEQAADFFSFAVRRGISLSELRVLPINGVIRWAVLPIVNPGRTMLLLGASVAREVAAEVEAGLRQLCQVFQGRDVQLVQALLDPSDTPTLTSYQRCSFVRMAELIYLHRTIRRAPKVPQLPAGLAMQTYSPATHGDFAAAILASYQESLDCPLLNGRRDIQDVIVGHQASGDFDPACWFVLQRGGEPVAVLLLNRSGVPGGMELVYLGLAPAVRGQGLGHYLMSFAQAWMVDHKLTSLTLAVDSINTPALRLYQGHGLQRVLSKIALMRDVSVA